MDVGAIEYIHKRLIEERDNGKAVLVVSFELDEILNVSDRIAVIHDGKIQGIVSPETTNKQELGVLMAGGNLGKEKSDCLKNYNENFGSLDFCLPRNFTRGHCYVDLRL